MQTLIYLFPHVHVHVVQQQTFAATGLSDKDKNICGAAITIFRSVLFSLYDGSITVSMLKKFHSKQVRVNNIVIAISKTLLKEKDMPDTKTVLTKRLREYDNFMEYQKQMQHLCHHFNDLNIEGNVFMAFFNNDYYENNYYLIFL